ncbi:MAG: tRNA 2-thiocytidine(32) synthetase TtcA [Bdellovibrio sp.]
MKNDLTHPLAVSIRKQIVEASARYQMISEGDRVLVCVSGGKDSSVLLASLKEIQRRAPYRFTLEAVILDQGQLGFEVKAFQNWVESLGVPLHVLQRDTYSIVTEKIRDGVYCSLCSRLRRGILYDFAAEKGFDKMALGHHREDLNETLLMNLFYTGKLASMPPKLRSDDGRNILIRPLCLVAEKDLARVAADWQIPIIPCNLCGSQDGLKRKMIKRWIAELEEKIPEIRNSMLAAQSNIKISQLSDEEFWNFRDLQSVPRLSEEPRIQ